MFAGHELKTPVTVMKASLDMLEREGVHSKYLDYAVEENEKMRKLVIELLDYSKMEYQEEKSVFFCGKSGKNDTGGRTQADF